MISPTIGAVRQSCQRAVQNLSLSLFVVDQLPRRASCFGNTVSVLLSNHPTAQSDSPLASHRLGAATAFVIWSSFPENAWVLSIFGLFYSIPCFYFIVAKPQYATSARFVLLTYNLTCLYWCVPTVFALSGGHANDHQLQHSREGRGCIRHRIPACARRDHRSCMGCDCFSLLVARGSSTRAQSSAWRVSLLVPTLRGTIDSICGL